MKKIIIYMIGLLLSFNVLANQGKVMMSLNGENQVALQNNYSIEQKGMRVISSFQMPSSTGSVDQVQQGKQQDELFTEISIYALIIMIYSLYWMKVS